MDVTQIGSSISFLGKDVGEKVAFRTTVVSFLYLVGTVSEVLETTLYKLRSTMVNVGADSLSQFRDRAVLTLVSEQSVVEAGTSNVFQFSPNRGDLEGTSWGN